MTHILALIDGSSYTHSVCDHVAWAAQEFGGEVELLHVLSQRKNVSIPSDLSGAIGLGARSALLEDLTEHDAATARLAKERGRAILDAAQLRLDENGIQGISLALRHGEIAETLSKRAGDLIVMGKRGEGADFEKLHLGANLERVVRAVHQPVLVASRSFQPIKTAVFAFDDGVSARKALDRLSTQRMTSPPKVIVLSVTSEGTELADAAVQAAQRLIQAGYQAETQILAGDAEQVISDHVETVKADLLIMGAYGHSRIRSLIIGSTTTWMIRSCRIPVLLFR